MSEPASFLTLQPGTDALGSANPNVMQHGGAEDSENPAERKLRRAWELISGKGPEK